MLRLPYDRIPPRAFAIDPVFAHGPSSPRAFGLLEPFNKMIPLVEFSLSTALDRGASGRMGTINPGIIWAGRYVQLDVEALIPVDRSSGSRTGWIAQLHFYLDDLFPRSFGRPLFGNRN
jgi:hypothetical protein